jgi:hypothetical protein
VRMSSCRRRGLLPRTVTGFEMRMMGLNADTRARQRRVDKPEGG